MNGDRTSVERLDDFNWSRPPGFPRRLDVRATRITGPRDGLRIYAPQRALARIRYKAGRSPLFRWRSVTCTAPPSPVVDLIAASGIAADGVVAMRASSADRWIIGLESAGLLVAVAKCGPLHDVGLRHEASILQELRAAEPRIRLPELLFAGEASGQFAVITRAAPPREGHASLADIGEVTSRLTNGALGVPMVHGDLAHWNMIRADGRIWLLDWEQSRPERRPLWDLADHLFREGVLVGTYTPRQLIGHLTERGSVGWNHLVAVDEDPSSARQFLVDYLKSRPTLGKDAHRFDAGLRGIL